MDNRWSSYIHVAGEPSRRGCCPKIVALLRTPGLLCESCSAAANQLMCLGATSPSIRFGSDSVMASLGACLRRMRTERRAGVHRAIY